MTFLGLPVWALSSAIGPPVGGALSSAGQWRWLFYRTLFSLLSIP
jgi:MFS family permease